MPKKKLKRVEKPRSDRIFGTRHYIKFSKALKEIKNKDQRGEIAIFCAAVFKVDAGSEFDITKFMREAGFTDFKH